MTSRKLNSGWSTAEAFLLSPKNAQPYRSMAFYFERPEFPVEESLLMKLDVPTAVLDWAMEQLEADLMEWYKNQPVGTPLPNQLVVTQADPFVISGLWIRGRCRDAIQAIESQTRDRELREFVAAHLWLPNLVERAFS